MLVVNQTEGELAVLSVNQTKWPGVILTNQEAETSMMLSTHLSALTSSTHLYSDEGVASELLRQQQFRQQRAAPLVSEACQLMLGANLDKVRCKKLISFKIGLPSSSEYETLDISLL